VQHVKNKCLKTFCLKRAPKELNLELSHESTTECRLLLPQIIPYFQLTCMDKWEVASTLNKILDVKISPVISTFWKNITAWSATKFFIFFGLLHVPIFDAAEFYMLSTVTCLMVGKLVLSNFLDWEQKPFRLNLDDWSFNGAFPFENATSLNEQFVSFTVGNFCWWFTSKLHTKPPLIYYTFWFMPLEDIHIQLRCHFSQQQY
jgi:hypothetical protein